MKQIKRILGIFLFLLITITVIIGGVAMTINTKVQNEEKENIICAVKDNDDPLPTKEKQDLAAIDPDCVLVLGCGILDEETPSPMLRDRLDAALKLYQEGVVPKILLSGDNGTREHNELRVMFRYVKDAGVPKKDIFCDHAGFSTYESMWRADDVFQVKSMVIVTQNYHMYRSLYIAHKLGITAKGVSADQQRYAGQAAREIREVLARNKDFIQCITKPKATFGGDPIPISGSGVPSQQGADSDA